MRIRVALAAFAAATALLAAVLWRALRLDDVRAAAAPVSAPGAGETEDRSSGDRERYTAERVLDAVAKDPFHPHRRRPAHRFRLPSDVAVAVPSPGASPGVRVVGTAVVPGGGGFAMCAWAGGTPRIVRVGERVGEWTLSRVTPGAAEFTAATGTTVIVRIAKAGGGT